MDSTATVAIKVGVLFFVTALVGRLSRSAQHKIGFIGSSAVSIFLMGILILIWPPARTSLVSLTDIVKGVENRLQGTEVVFENEPGKFWFSENLPQIEEINRTLKAGKKISIYYKQGRHNNEVWEYATDNFQSSYSMLRQERMKSVYILLGILGFFILGAVYSFIHGRRISASS